MSKGFVIITMLASMSAGIFIGQRWNSGGAIEGCSLDAHATATAAAGSVERYKVALGDAPSKGPAHAKVTIVELSDFQCPYCSRVEPTIDQVMRSYGKDVRVVWKNEPLTQLHPNAWPAAQLAMAVYAKQGSDGFWKLHDTLFHNQRQLGRPDLEKYGHDAGLDDGELAAAFDGKKFDARIGAEAADGVRLGARGTPGFFINGRFLSGAQPFSAFQKIIDEELVAADQAMKRGVPLAGVYDALVAGGKAQAATPPAPQRPAVDPNLVYKVPVGGSPHKGRDGAKVTIVEFSDFQCPYCARVEPVLSELQKEYGDDLRLVWKNLPLATMHPNAVPAAKAALAAKAQGKFWEMHDKLFADQRHLDAATYEKYAGELGLDLARFRADVANPRADAELQADTALATKLGINGTPAFFIDGHPLRGTHPKEDFKAIIDKERAAADAALARGIEPAGLYAELTKSGKERADAAPAAAARPGQPDGNTVYRALVGDAPSKGGDARTAKVTIVEWSDFQCPYCGRVEPTIEQILKTYGNDVRIVFKQKPLPMHANARLAAEASLAAKAQGKFWELHDVMFENQQALDRASLEKDALALGLDVARFKADLDSGKWKAKVDAELAEGEQIGGGAAPAFFINGKPIIGAYPFATFKARIDAELAAAAAKAHGRYDKYYDELMKGATRALAGAAPPLPPVDNTIYRVDPGHAPALAARPASAARRRSSSTAIASSAWCRSTRWRR